NSSTSDHFCAQEHPLLSIVVCFKQWYPQLHTNNIVRYVDVFVRMPMAKLFMQATCIPIEFHWLWNRFLLNLNLQIRMQIQSRASPQATKICSVKYATNPSTPSEDS